MKTIKIQLKQTFYQKINRHSSFVLIPSIKIDRFHNPAKYYEVKNNQFKLHIWAFHLVFSFLFFECRIILSKYPKF